MITVQEQIKRIVFTKVRELNGSNTEEDLSMVITEKLLADKFSLENLKKKIEVINGEIDDDKLQPNGAWIYRENPAEKWLFERFDTIADAIRAAVKNINAIVLCEGEEVNFDTLDNDRAYYIERLTGKIKVVNLNV